MFLLETVLREEEGRCAVTISHIGDKSIRIEFYRGRAGLSDGFVDISAVPDCGHFNSLQFQNMSAFGYWAVVKQPGNYCSPHAIVVFPNKRWFDEWREKENPEIVFEEGRKGGAR
jgi:hypothetical protein